MGGGPEIPISTFVWAGVSNWPVYALCCHGNMVQDGEEYYFYFGQAHTHLTERWQSCPLGTLNYGIAGHLAYRLT